MEKVNGMVEIAVPCWSGYRYIEGKLNPDRVEKYFVRAKTKKRCLELLNEKTKSSYTMNSLREYGSDGWGTYIVRPIHEGEGIWLTRDFSSRDLVELWVETQETIDEFDELRKSDTNGRLPQDWENPEWGKREDIHNWRNYIPNMVQKIWNTFTPLQKKVLAYQADAQALQEDWD